MASLQERFPSDPCEHTRCLRSQNRLPIDFGRFSARHGALRQPFRRPVRPWALSGRPWEALGTLLGRTGDAPDRPSKLLGRAGVPPERPGIVLASILGPAEAVKDRFWIGFSMKQHRYDIDMLGSTWHHAGIDVVRSIGQAARVAGSIWWQPFDLTVDDSTNA